MAKPASGATLDSGHALATGLALALPFTEGSGSTSADVSTGGRTWTANAVTWTTEGGDACVTNSDATTAGTLSSALNLPGNQDWSIAWRSKHNAATTNGMLFGEAANTTDFVYARNDAGNRSMRFRDSNNNNGIITQVTSFAAAVEDYVLLYDNAAQTLELYRDGVSAGSVAFTAGANIDIDCVIGGNNGTLAHVGTLHYLYVWNNRKLNSTEIGDIYTDPYAMLDAPAPSDSVTISYPQMVQRGATSAAVALSGTYSAATADAVQARVLLTADNSEVVGWADVDPSLSGGTWTGSVTVNTGGPYYCEARLHDSSNNILASSSAGANFIVGEIFGNIGQSNASGRGTSNQTYGGSAVAWSFAEAGSVDTTLSDPISTDSGAGGSWVPLLATLLSAKLGSSVPLGFVTYAEGGTGLDASGWLPTAGTVWVAAKARFDAVATGGLKAVLWLQGERDTGLSVAEATYQAREVTLVTNVAAWAGAPPLIVTLTGHQSAELDADIDDIRKAKITNWNSGATLAGACPIDIDLLDDAGDGLHYKTNADLAQVAARMYLAIEQAFYGGSDGRGPRLVSATINDTLITLLFDKDLLTATTYTTSAFVVKDNATPVTVDSVTQAGTREVRLALAVSPSGTVTVTFGSGDDAVGATIPRAQSVALPAMINSISAVTIPAEPIYDAAVSVGQVQRIKNQPMMGVG